MSKFTLVKDSQNFGTLLHQDNTGRMTPLVEESQIFDENGYDFLYIGKMHHLSKQDVRLLIQHLQYWVNHNELGT